MAGMSLRAAIDIGGTFTDVQVLDERDGRQYEFKVPTTPDDPSIGLIEGVTAAAGALGCPLDAVKLIVHGTNARELEFLVRAGLSPLEALRAATSVAALAIKRPNLGMLAPGRSADVLVFDGDPIADIASLQDHARIVAVLKEGELVAGKVGAGRFAAPL